MSRALLLTLTLCWGIHAHAGGAARLQVAGMKQVTPWLAVELAQGGQLQESLDVRVSDAQGCLQERVTDLENICLAEETSYWGTGAKKGIQRKPDHRR